MLQFMTGDNSAVDTDRLLELLDQLDSQQSILQDDTIQALHLSGLDDILLGSTSRTAL